MDTSTDFWSKPEGKFGMVVTALLGGGFLYGLYKVLPALVQMAQNTLILGVYVTIISAGFYVLVIDSSLRNMCANFWKRACRAGYILSFNVDPINGLRVRIKELRQRIAFAQERIGEMQGQAQAVRNTIAQNDRLIDQNLSIMEAARKRNEPEAATAASIKAGVARDANEKELQPLADRIDRSVAVLKDIVKKSALNVDVLETVVGVKERSYKVAKAGRSALRAAKEVLLGNTEKDDVFKMNMEWIDEYTAMAMGEMDAVLSLNEGAIKSIDLTQASYSDKAFAMLEERQGKLRHLLVEDPRAKKLLEAGFQAAALPAATPAPVAISAGGASSGSDFDHLFHDR